MKRGVVLAILMFWTVFGYSGLIPLPKDTNLEMLGEMNIAEVYDGTLNCNMTDLCVDILEWDQWASIKFGYGIEKDRWVFGTGANLSVLAKRIEAWTDGRIKMSIPILDKLDINTTFLMTYKPEATASEPAITFQVGAIWKLLDF